VVLEYIKAHQLVTRREVLERFMRDDEAQVRSVLRDLAESQLVFSSGSGMSTSYRAASEQELATLQKKLGDEGADELLVALMYREGALTLREIADRAQIDASAIEPMLERLLSTGRIQLVEEDGEQRYEARALLIPLGSAAGWEAAVFDHFKALTTTILTRLSASRGAALEDQVGGSTYTIDVWAGHPLEGEAFGTLAKIRSMLSDLRARVAEYNEPHGVPDVHTRVVIYAGQCLIHEGSEHVPQVEPTS
jgi:hypothetical protein